MFGKPPRHSEAHLSSQADEVLDRPQSPPQLRKKLHLLNFEEFCKARDECFALHDPFVLFGRMGHGAWNGA